MRFVLILVVILFGVFSFGTPDTLAGGLVPCDGVGDDGCQACHAIKLIENVVDWLIAVLSIVAAIIITYAGIRLVVSGGNTSAMETAKKLITNVIIGYTLLLAGWLIVDTAVKALLSDQVYGTWNQIQCVEQPKAEESKKEYIILAQSNPSEALSTMPGWTNGSSGSMVATCDADGIKSDGSPTYNCAVQVAQCQSTASTASVNTAAGTVTCTSSYGGKVDSSGLGQCNPSNGACSVSALMGYGLDSRQANIMSCIAMTESSGIPTTPPHNVTNPGSNSSACGTFQILRSTWKDYATGACTSFSNCQNASCNAKVMSSLVKNNGYNDWTCPKCNEKAPGCIAKYGG